MNTTLDKISHKAQRAAASVIIDKVLAMVDKDREKGFLELIVPIFFTFAGIETVSS